MLRAIPDYPNADVPQNTHCDTLSKRLNLIGIVENPCGKPLVQWLALGVTDSDKNINLFYLHVVKHIQCFVLVFYDIKTLKLKKSPRNKQDLNKLFGHSLKDEIVIPWETGE